MNYFLLFIWIVFISFVFIRFGTLYGVLSILGSFILNKMLMMTPFGKRRIVMRKILKEVNREFPGGIINSGGRQISVWEVGPPDYVWTRWSNLEREIFEEIAAKQSHQRSYQKAAIKYLRKRSSDSND